jgi:hypothetical protein
VASRLKQRRERVGEHPMHIADDYPHASPPVRGILPF